MDEERKLISELKHSRGGQALLAYSKRRVEAYTKQLIAVDPRDAAATAHWQAKIRAYQILVSLIESEVEIDGEDEGPREAVQGIRR